MLMWYWGGVNAFDVGTGSTQNMHSLYVLSTRVIVLTDVAFLQVDICIGEHGQWQDHS